MARALLGAALLGTAAAHIVTVCTSTSGQLPGVVTVWLGTYHDVHAAGSVHRVEGTAYIEDPSGRVVTHDLYTVCDLASQGGAFVEYNHSVDFIGENIKQYCGNITQNISDTFYPAFAPESSVVCYDKDPNGYHLAKAMRGTETPFFCSEVWEYFDPTANHTHQNMVMNSWYPIVMPDTYSGGFKIWLDTDDANLLAGGLYGYKYEDILQTQTSVDLEYPCSMNLTSVWQYDVSVAQGDHQCHSAPVLSDAVAALIDGSLSQCIDLDEGSQCGATCIHGYTASGSIECRDGEWVSTFSCDTQTCTKPTTGDNGEDGLDDSVSGVDPNVCTFSTPINGTCPYYCGAKLSPYRIKCVEGTDHGVWQAAPDNPLTDLCDFVAVTPAPPTTPPPTPPPPTPAPPTPMPPTPMPPTPMPMVSTRAPPTSVPWTPAPPTPTPDVTTPSPKTTTPSPDMTTPSPDVTTPSPDVTTPSPDVTTPSPDVTTPSPDVTTPSPDVTTPSPDMTTPSPDVTTPSPDVTTPSPDMTTPSPQDPTTSQPTTGIPTTGAPTTGEPTTGAPMTGEPGVVNDTGAPTTGVPTTGVPTTGEPTTGNPVGETTLSPQDPTTSQPTTGIPTTGAPTTGEPTTGAPTTGEPGVVNGTGAPTTGIPTTGEPTTGAPTTGVPAPLPTGPPGEGETTTTTMGTVTVMLLPEKEDEEGGFLWILFVVLGLVGVAAIGLALFVSQRRRRGADVTKGKKVKSFEWGAAEAALQDVEMCDDEKFDYAAVGADMKTAEDKPLAGDDKPEKRKKKEKKTRGGRAVAASEAD